MSEPSRPLSRPKAVIFLLLALLLSSLWANPNAPLVSSAHFYLYSQQSVSVTNGRLTDLRINFSIPIDSAVVQAPSSARLLTDSQNNPFLAIYEPNPALPYTYAINTTISTVRQSVNSLPTQWSAPDTAADDLASTTQTPAADPAFARLSAQITQNATTPFEQISDLAIWVHDYITYDPSMVGQDLSAPQILQAQRGVCTEYATLFVTLARSLGYPTRFVNGYAYSDKYNAWLGHAWAEVYIGQWVSVDPTWLEVGRLDATHIVSSRQAVQDFQSASVTALVDPSAQLIWQGGESRGAVADNVHLISQTEDAPETDYSLYASSPAMPAGAHFIAFMQYPATDYRVLDTNLAPCRNDAGPPIVGLSTDADQRLTTRPGDSSYAIWYGQASSSLESNVRYTCPLTLNSEYLDLRTVPLNITTAGRVYWPALQAALAHPTVEIGQAQQVFVRLSPAMAGHPVTLLEEHLMMTASLDAQGEAVFTFNATRRGLHTLYTFSDAGDPAVLPYTVGATNGLAITDIRPAAVPIAGQSGALNITWAAPAGTDTSSWQLQWTWDGQSGQVPLTSGPGTLSVPFTPATPGDQVLTVRLLNAHSEEMLRQSQLLTALSASTVTVAGVELLPGAASGQWQARVQLDINGTMQDLQLHLDNRVISVPADGNVSVDLLPGMYNATLTWTDAAGAPQSQSFSIDATQSPNNVITAGESAVNTIASSGPSLNLLLLPLALIFVIGLGALVWLFRHPPRTAEGDKPPSPV